MATLTVNATSASPTAGSWLNIGNAAGAENGTTAAWTDTSRRGSATARGEFAASLFDSIPAGSTINSITIRAKGYVSNAANIPTVQVRSLVAGTQVNQYSVGSQTATTNVWTQSETGLTVSDLKSGNTQIEISYTRANNTQTATGFVDAFGLVIDYSPPVIPDPITGTDIGTVSIDETVDLVKTDAPTGGNGEITYVGSASTTAGATNGIDVTTALPAGIQTDDLLLMIVGFNLDVTPNVPAGWTQLFNLLDSGVAPAAANLVVYYKFAGPTETAPAWSSSLSSTGTLPLWNAIISAYRGVDKAAPFLSEAGAQHTEAGDTTHSAGPIQSDNPNKWAVYAGHMRQVPTPASWTAPDTLTERVDIEAGATNSTNPSTIFADSNGAVADISTITYTGTSSAASALAVAWAGFLTPGASGPAADPIVGTDSSTVSISEEASLTKQISVSDGGALSIAETTAVFKDIQAADVSAVSITEARTTSVALASTDAGSLAITESVAASITRAAIDAGSVSITETSSLFKAISATDSGSISITETGTPLADFPGGDSAVLSVTEASAVEISGQIDKSASDAGALTIGEATSQSVTTSGNDSATLAISESVNFSADVAKSGSDSAALSISETVSLFKAISASDTAALTIDESFEFSPVDISATDSSTLSLTETTGLFFERPGADASALQIVETSQVVISGGNAYLGEEIVSLAISETSSLAISLERTDAAEISITESRTFEPVLVEAADVSGLGIVESISFETEDILASDSSALSITEEASIALKDERTASGTDAATLDIEEASHVFKTVQAHDVNSLAMVESVQFFKGLQASDSLVVGIAESAGTYQEAQASDSLALSLTESSSLEAAEGFYTKTAFDSVTIEIVDYSKKWDLGGINVPIRFASNTERGTIMTTAVKRANKRFGTVTERNTYFE